MLAPLSAAVPLSFGLAAPLAARAQSPLETVVVTASRLPQPLTEALPHTTVISREDIVRAQVPDLPSLLAREAGLQITSNGGLGTATSIFMRGAGSSQVLIMVDGMPMTKQDATGTVSIEQLMLDQVERVEIVRGNVSAIYGSGAVGGVIQIFTRRHQGPPRASVQLEAGSHGTSRASASIGGRQAATSWTLGASYLTTDGFSAIDAKKFATANPDDDGYRNRSLTLGLSHEVAAGHTLGLRAFSSQGRGEYDSGSSFDAPGDVHTRRSRLGSVQVQSDNRWTQAWESMLSLGEFRDRDINAQTGSFDFESDARTRTRALQWNNTLALAPRWQATAGVSRQYQRIDTDEYEKSRTVDALYAGVSGTAGPHSVQVNLRHDDTEGVGSKSTYYLGYGFQLTEQWKAIASASTAFNAPPLGYLYAPFFGNPDLRPEHARNQELGVQYAQGVHVLRITAFRARLRDQLVYDFATNRFENVARTRNRGVELSYSGRLGRTDLRASLTRQDPRDEDTDERLNRRAKTLASLAVSHELAGWRLGMDWRYTGERPDAAQAQTLSDYSVVDLTVRRSIGRRWSVFGRIENAGNTRYETAYGYRQAERSAYVGLQWQADL